MQSISIRLDIEDTVDNHYKRSLYKRLRDTSDEVCLDKDTRTKFCYAYAIQAKYALFVISDSKSAFSLVVILPKNENCSTKIEK